MDNDTRVLVGVGSDLDVRISTDSGLILVVVTDLIGRYLVVPNEKFKLEIVGVGSSKHSSFMNSISSSWCEMISSDRLAIHVAIS